jgi:hypothetical protein
MIIDSTLRAFRFLSARRAAYQAIFLRTRQRSRLKRTAYRILFTGPVAETVLQDLMRFCRANETCFHEDARIHAVLEGRREVWNRIQAHLNLPPEDLWKLQNPTTPLTLGE